MEWETQLDEAVDALKTAIRTAAGERDALLKQVEAGKRLAEATDNVLHPDLAGPGQLWEHTMKPVAYWMQLEQALADWRKAEGE